MFSQKLSRFVDQFLTSYEELAQATGISNDRLRRLLNGNQEPSGDEVLILADIFHCDYKYFISNDKEAVIEQTEILFRRYKSEFSKEDRMAVQEILYMAECEHFLMNELGKLSMISNFEYIPYGYMVKNHAEEGAKKLRKHLKLSDYEVDRNVFENIRQAGFHVFRRKLKNSKISGLTVRHPIAGRCVLINYNEDVYRQRFTAIHEAAHGIFDLDENENVYVSYNSTEYNKRLAEIRANKFASYFLMPRTFLLKIPQSSVWDNNKIIKWANELKVNPESISIALNDMGLIDDYRQKQFKLLKIPKSHKTDAELPDSLSDNAKTRKTMLLEKGLSNHYVKLCFDAYMQGIVTLPRIAEMLLVDENELHEIRMLYGVNL